MGHKVKKTNIVASKEPQSFQAIFEHLRETEIFVRKYLSLVLFTRQKLWAKNLIALSPRSIGLRGVHIYVRKYLRAMLDCGEIVEISELNANHYQNWFKMLHSVTRTVQYIGSNVEEKAE